MELNKIYTRTTWNDAAGSINSNYAKIADAIAQLKANGGGGGSGADIDLTAYATKVWVETKGYITASTLTPYALKTDIPSLVGYATEDFVNSKLGDYATKDYVTTKLVDYAPLTSVQGFENRIKGLEGAVPQLNERVTTVEGKVSSLNELVSTGENNLLDRVNTIETDYVTSGNLESAINGIDLSAYLLKADLTKSRIQSTLGISDWALAATKPSYSWSEILSRPTALSQFTDDIVAGKYLPLSGGTVVGEFAIKAGATNSATIRFSPNSGAINHWLGVNSAGVLWFSNNGWSQQYDILHSGNIGDYKLSQFTDDVVAGKYLPLSGGTLSNAAWRSQLTIERSGSTNDSVIAFKNSNGLLGCLGYRGADGIPCVWLGETGTGVPIIHANNIGSYNAGSATKLQTARSIWGQSFDGTRNVTGHLRSDTWRIVTDATFDGAFFQSKNYDGTSNAGNIYLTGWDVYTLESFNVRAKNSYFSNNVIASGNINASSVTVSGNVKASGLFMNIGKEISPYASNRAEIALINPNAEPSMLRLGSNGDVKWGIETRGSTDNYAFSIYSWTAATHCLRILNNGNVGIGNTSPTERLDVSGNIKASGNINATSITINGVTITASNGSITVNGNVFATGDITGGV